MENIRVSKNDILKQVSIIDIANHFSIGLDKVSAGNFDYKCRCPSINHKHGRERTSSLYINMRDNNFFCYGCNAGSSVIDFYMLCAQKDFSEAFRELKSWVKQPGKYSDLIDKKRESLPFLVENSKIIRSFLFKQNGSIEEIDDFLKKLDDIIFENKKDDIIYFEALNKKLKKKLGVKK